jgi:hypothetical protein
MDREGKHPQDPKLRKEIPWKVASNLKKYGSAGWAGLEPYHLKGH